MKPALVLVALALAAAALVACTSTSYTRYEFRPRPLTVDVQGPADAGFVARAMVSILGIRDATPEEGTSQVVHVRMQLENLSRRTISLDAGRWKLVSANLVDFGAPLARPADPGEVLPGAQTAVDLFFPVTPGHALADHDLSALNLRFGVNYEDATVVVTATFERWVVEPYGVYPAPYGAYGYAWPGTVGASRATVGVGIGVGF